jgi:hypothetical protein
MQTFKYSFAIFCKSYRRDFLRLQRLLTSIEQFNIDQLPVFVSTPQEDQQLFLETNGQFSFVHWVSDEAIIESNPSVPKGIQIGKDGYIVQAMVRPEFWRMGYAENYLCIDSDSVFIKDFYLADFMTDDGVPYTILHQNKELLQTACNLKKHKVVDNFFQETTKIKSIFGRSGPDYAYVPSPFIWSARVWESLDKNYLKPNNMTIWDVVTRELVEYLWYGEALLKYQAIPLRPIEPLFRVYHYDWQYYTLKRQGEKIDTLKRIYLGIIYQSNWESEMDFGAPQKSIGSRILKQLKRRMRQTQSYF